MGNYAVKKILLAVGHRELEDYIENKLSKKYEFVGKTVYKEGIIKSIVECAPDILIIRETLPGNENIMNIIYEIRNNYGNIRIIFIAGKRKIGDQLLSTLVSYGIYDIIFGENIQAGSIISLIEKKNNYNDVKHLQPIPVLDEKRNKIFFEQREIENSELTEEDIFPKDKKKKQLSFYKKTEKEKIKKKIEEKNQNEKKIITFLGGKPGVGTTSIAVNTAFQLAVNGFKTIYLEFNPSTPSVCYWYELGLISEGIDTALDNLKKERYKEVQNAIIKTINLKKQNDNYKGFPNCLDFMFFSKEYLSRLKNDSNSLSSKDLFMYLLYQLNYDYVVIDVPSDIYNESTLDALMFSNKIFSVITQDISSIGYYLFKIWELEKRNINVLFKNTYILNLYQIANFDIKEIKEWLNINDLIIMPLILQDFVDANFHGMPVIFNTQNQEFLDNIEKIINNI